MARNRNNSHKGKNINRQARRRRDLATWMGLILIGTMLVGRVVRLIGPSTASAQIHRTPLPTEVQPEPEISLVPTSARPGEAITVRGTGFGTNEVISIQLQSPEGENAVLVPAITADVRGAFSTTIDLPEQWSDGHDINAGQLTVDIRNSRDQVQASADLTVEPKLSTR